MAGPSEVITQPIPTMYFFGVTTSQSSSRRMFPHWAEILELGPAQLVGVDLPINAPPEDYRRAVLQIRRDPLSLGALVTTHKMHVYRAARDLFDEFSADAQLCGEVACIYKREDRLIGHAIDPETSGIAMRRFIQPGYWAESGAHVLCLGAGGAAVALCAHFITRAAPQDRPRRITLVDHTPARLGHLQALIDSLPDAGIDFALICNTDPHENDRLMRALPPGSLVINATGMGKDTPGSPITEAAVFPQNGLAWELNYRGELGFLRQAQAQAAARRLTVEDGWYYFLLGWAYVVGPVFDVEITPERFSRLAEAAAAIR